MKIEENVVESPKKAKANRMSTKRKKVVSSIEDAAAQVQTLDVKNKNISQKLELLKQQEDYIIYKDKIRGFESDLKLGTSAVSRTSLNSELERASSETEPQKPYEDTEIINIPLKLDLPHL